MSTAIKIEKTLKRFIDKLKKIVINKLMKRKKEKTCTCIYSLME